MSESLHAEEALLPKNGAPKSSKHVSFFTVSLWRDSSHSRVGEELGKATGAEKNKEASSASNGRGGGGSYFRHVDLTGPVFLELCSEVVYVDALG